MDVITLQDQLRQFTFNGTPTLETEAAGIAYFVNEYWTSAQRQAHNLHEISYRACFKPQLPEFFIDRLTRPGDTVYDPFAGRGTTPLQAALMGCRPVGNDITPLPEMLVRHRLEPVSLHAVAKRLQSIGVGEPSDADDELTVFFHPETLGRIGVIRAWLLERAAKGTIDSVDRWIRMVALNRLTGHSPGFFSVYTLPPNQAASLTAQRKINEKRRQTPPTRDVDAIILKKSRGLLSDGSVREHPPALFMTGPADRTPELADSSVD